MTIRVWKMHGAGNDFVLVDDRTETFPCSDTAWLQRIATRRTGIGCEGIILIQPSQVADFRMRFFNPDGCEVEMCGNGARCVARLAHDLGVTDGSMSIETQAGVLQAVVLNADVRLTMSQPCDWRLNIVLQVENVTTTASSVNTGVPHVVVPQLSLRDEDLDVVRLGSAIRHHSVFAPEGTNVNFTRVEGPHRISIRTYERGVEAETLACGTGIVAGALVNWKEGHVTPPVEVATAGGNVLTVDFPTNQGEAIVPNLQGPAVHVFEGNIEYRASS